jgi:hypothetical protein
MRRKTFGIGKWYILVGRLSVSILEKEHRYWGRDEDYYDGPIKMFGLWYFHFVYM